MGLKPTSLSEPSDGIQSEVRLQVSAWFCGAASGSKPQLSGLVKPFLLRSDPACRSGATVPCSRGDGLRSCASRWTHLPLDLPHVDEVLGQLGGQQVLASQDGERPGRAVPAPVGEQAGAAVQVEHGDVPKLGARVTADYHLQRSRHVGSSTTIPTREPPVHSGRCRREVTDDGIRFIRLLPLLTALCVAAPNVELTTLHPPENKTLKRTDLRSDIQSIIVRCIEKDYLLLSMHSIMF